MAKLIILYNQPHDPAAFEHYFTGRHQPYADAHMPNVRDVENLRIVGTPDGTQAAYYRISQLTFGSLEDLRRGVDSPAGQSVVGDLTNFATAGASVMIAHDLGQ